MIHLNVYWVRTSDQSSRELSGIRPVWCEKNMLEETISALHSEAAAEGLGRRIVKIEVLTLTETLTF